MSNIKVFGYGTFITGKMYEKYKDIRAVYLPGYIRVCRKFSSFPFVMKANESNGFWGLVFEVTEDELKRLDHYEGLDLGLYERITVECIYKNGQKKQVFLYVPTKETIELANLAELSDKDDFWYDRIQENIDITAIFPELIYQEHPNKMRRLGWK